MEEVKAMSVLTKKMSAALRNADLDRGVINDVPLGTMYGLVDQS
jgi:hypothetical protein